ncbi:hypothetical protein [Phormidium sp. CCY1219]|uniref:hypothetical protein n=1 Tax=Phormidium sp. CCY1219 TaxID=2886104 RepID=UPI002D1F3468|nr:hypothetical protein [Phormidium sp. CCY1219]MEB3829425.1 hypothetical protein [Phormidium sp. CCY1219]
MNGSFQGIPGLPDLTHPNELIEFGGQVLKISVTLVMLVVGLGIAIAVLNWSTQGREEGRSLVEAGLTGYLRSLQILPHFALVLTLLVGGFFLCSTLANRYHHWEQGRIQEVAAIVSGDRLEQAAPQIRYVVEETYTYDRWVDGEPVKVEDTREVNRYLAIAASQIDVTLNQATDPSNEKAIYLSDFEAEYEVINRLNEKEDFFFEFRPPYGYSLLQNFHIERDGRRLVQVNPGDYGFPFSLEAGEATRFRVWYQAQGGPRWVYDAGGKSVSKFQLTVLANFDRAEFASGIVPTERKLEREGTRFSWVFEENVSVRNPFGVFTATDPVRNTGVLPRLLLLAPGIFLWWIMLLYLSVPMRLSDVAIAAGIFFACLLSLTYFSRLMDVKLAWMLVFPVLLGLVWGLGKNRQAGLAVLLSTIAGAVLPVLGLIVSYSGFTLSLAALLSVAWLGVRHWYGWRVIR